MPNRTVNKTGLTAGYVITSVLLVAITCLSPLAFPLMANAVDDMPTAPAIYYGTVTLSGTAAPVGTILRAEIDGVVRGNFTTTVVGSYLDMLVVNGYGGAVVQFYANGIAAGSTSYAAGRYLVNLSTGGGSIPAAPVLYSPSSGATGVTTTPTLQWIASSGAASYGVQVSLSSGFGSFVVNQTGITATQLALTSALIAGNTYYWRVNATNGYGTSSWASPWSFTVAATPTPPAAPLLSSPLDTSTGIATSPLLQWNTSTGATSYSVQLSAYSTFSPIIFSQSGVTATAVSVTPALSNNITYYWRVNATGSGGTSSWSTTWRFTTLTGGGTGTLPAFFRGIAYKNGTAVDLKQVCAVINSVPTCVSSDGLGNYIIEVYGNDGDAVSFTVDGSAATEPAIFRPGWMTILNLHSGTGVLAVTTGSGTYVNGTTATLGGTLVSLSSLDTTATPSIDYGPTTSYGSTWTMSSMAPGTFTTPNITGLSAGQVIHFKARATGNTTGTTASGSDATYTHAVPGSLTVLTTSLPSGTVGTAYSTTLSASGGTAPYTWSVVSGSLPAWATLTAGTGVIAGSTPTAGTSTLTVRVTDALSATATSGTLTITISPAGSLAVLTTSLPAGTVGTAYSTTLSASGGTTPYTWSLVSGSLPVWVTSTLSTGTISGSAPTAGTSTFTVRVTDNVGATATSGSLTITIGTTPVACGSDPVGCTAGRPYTMVLPYWVYASRYAATATATVNHINVISYGAGNIKVAIYNDSYGGVGTLIPGSTGSGAVIAGLNSIPLDSTISITSGTTYWLAEWSDAPVFAFTAESGAYANSNVAYTSISFPTTAISWRYPAPGNFRGLISGSN